MKLSVSLPDSDVVLLDRIAHEQGGSRSAVVHKAIALLRRDTLVEQYESAFEEFDGDGDAVLWESTSADGLSDESAA